LSNMRVASFVEVPFVVVDGSELLVCAEAKNGIPIRISKPTAATIDLSFNVMEFFAL
jgi:hypothetical protein